MTNAEVAPLREPLDALAARVALIDEASTTLDLQYYEWESDTVGHLLLDRVLAAADRGVAVRLLVDDLHFRSRTNAAADLSLHPKMSVRLFNPWSRRSSAVSQAVEFIMRFSKLDRRMHNKLLVADGAQAIVGGRNIADAHFGLHHRYNFVDYDVLITGPGVAGLAAAFHSYWNSDPAVPAETFDASAAPSNLEALRNRITRQVAESAGAVPADLANGVAWRDRAGSRRVRLAADDLHIVTDIPGPTRDVGPTQVIEALRAAASGAQRELTVLTPFFVPNELDIQLYTRLAKQGVRYRLLTNSLASNPGTISNSGLNRTREDVVRAGVELYELRPDAAVRPEWEIAPNVGGFLGLHAKLYVIDREKLFFGSVNLDPRSKFINTEIAISIDNAEYARGTADAIEAMMTPSNAWRVGIDGDGRVTWSDDRGTTRRQPARSVWQRSLDRSLQMLPLSRYI